MRYIEKVALSWAEDNINTLEKAYNYIKTYNKDYRLIMQQYGLNGRDPSPVEIDYMKKWLTSYNYDFDILKIAIDKTMQKINKPNFNYTDGIISNWYKNKVKTIEDVENLDKAYSEKKEHQSSNVSQNNKTYVPKNKFINYEQREWDFDELEKLEHEFMVNYGKVDTDEN